MPELLSNPSVLLRPAAGSPDAAALIDPPGARFRSRLSEFHLARPSEQFAVTGLALLAYIVAAAIVVVGAHSIIGDAWSRVGNAYYVLFSRDPHLAAVGFVWNPLPSLAVLPLLPLKAVWPDMVATGFAGSIVSAVCMAGAVWQVHGIATDWGVRRSAGLIVTLAFALNPMILYYGANGMSEAMFILTLILAVRYLSRWATGGQTLPLVVAGIALAAAYMTRYEAVVAAAGATGVVLLISATRHSGGKRDRLGEALADATIFAAPFGMAFVAWALASWLIVGDPFQQFSSVYGVVSQLQVAQSSVAQSTGQGTSAAYLWIARQLLGLEPGIIPLCAFGLVVSFRGRLGLAMPAVAILGAVVAFAVFGFLSGRTLGWLRYSITAIPLASILALAVLSPDPKTDPALVPGRDAERVTSGPRRLSVAGRLMGISAAALVTLAVPIGAITMLDPGSNPAYGGEAFQLRPVLFPNEPIGAITPFGQFEVGRAAAGYVDSMNLAGGSVLVDGAMGFPIILESRNPTQFITTSDRDFQEALLDPVSFKVKFLLVPEDVGYQSLDALNRAYPGIYDTGAGIGRFVQQFSAGGNNWRLYAVSQ
jgi:hypothetical protein